MTRAVEEARSRLKAGQPAEAERILRRELAERPARLLLARLANELGQAELAAEHAEFLTRRDPRDSEAWSALGFAAFTRGRRREARAALERAIALNPAYAVAHRNLASVLCDEELSEEALAAAAEAANLGAATPAVQRIRARALIQLDRFGEAEPLLQAVLTANAEDTQAHAVLTQLRQLRGDDDPLLELRAAARRPGVAAPVRLAFADALRRRGETAAALEELQSLIAELGPLPPLLGSLATVLLEIGRAPEALGHARAALAAAPQDAAIAEAFVASAIGAGAPDAAVPVIEQWRGAHPRDQRWITHRIDVARLRGEAALESWFEPKLVTRVYDLPVSVTSLARTVEARHRQRNHPLDQSLRNGTQTSRNLLVRPELEIAELLRLFGEATNEYLREVGAQFAEAAAHPLTSRSRERAELVGCWSVRLRTGGFHVNHIHPEGWVSSAFYLSVPGETADATRRAGWLKFGEPRHPVAGLDPTGFIQPLPGRLVLFPSYLWHGTIALSGDEPRLSVAFDAVPASERL